jgi:hypothetical protein
MARSKGHAVASEKNEWTIYLATLKASSVLAKSQLEDPRAFVDAAVPLE